MGLPYALDVSMAAQWEVTDVTNVTVTCGKGVSAVQVSANVIEFIPDVDNTVLDECDIVLSEAADAANTLQAAIVTVGGSLRVRVTVGGVGVVPVAGKFVAFSGPGELALLGTVVDAP